MVSLLFCSLFMEVAKALMGVGFALFYEGCNKKFGDYFSIYRHVKTSDSGGAVQSWQRGDLR